MSRPKLLEFFLLAALAGSLAGCNSNPYGMPPRNPRLEVPFVQGLLGVTEISETEYELDDSLNASVDSDDMTLPMLGAALQYPVWGGPSVQFGFEGGATVSWERDTVAVATGGGTIIVVADNDLFLADAFVGLSLNAFLGKRFRAWVGAGPLLQWGGVDMEYEDAGTPVDIEDDGFGSGVYARAGIEFEFRPEYWIGLSVRHVDSEIDFGDGIDDFEFEETQLMLSVSVRY